jgi:hypothetical protein
MGDAPMLLEQRAVFTRNRHAEAAGAGGLSKPYRRPALLLQMNVSWKGEDASAYLGQVLESHPGMIL